MMQKYIAVGALVYLQIFIIHSIWLRNVEKEQQEKYKNIEKRMKSLELELGHKNQEQKAQSGKSVPEGKKVEAS